MKIVVSIPDEVIVGAQRLAREVFSDAVREYVKRHGSGYVTADMNRLCRELGRARDEFVAAARRMLERSEW
jgi:hypothetical protein